MNLISKINRLINEPKFTQTYYPGVPRKGKLSILIDILTWLAKHKEFNYFYYIYGFDRKNTNAPNEVLAYKKFMQVRDSVNLHPKGANFNYAALLRDKFIFGQFLASLKFPTPKNIALLSNGTVTWLDTMITQPIESLPHKTDIHFDGFCKQLTGSMGTGAFPLSMCGGKIFSAEKELSPADIINKTQGQYLWQERLEQHEEMSRLHPTSINTMRLITFNNNGHVYLFSGTLRIGTKQNRVDNWNQGGIAIRIDTSTGTLRKNGFYKPGKGGSIAVHPDSGITFEGFKIPQFNEAVELVKRLHTYFYGIHSVGWDVAITPDGPALVEGNDDWDGSMPMALETDFKNRFLKMYRQ